MRRSQFEIGKKFRCGDSDYLCTDIGSRVVVAIPTDNIRIGTRAGSGEVSHHTIGADEAVQSGWLNGPPYALAEVVFDEDDQKACSQA